MSAPAGFTFRYAIRMPNGELYRHPQQQQLVDDYRQSSVVRDLNAWAATMMGLGIANETNTPPPGPVIFDNRQDAVRLLKEISDRAAAVGVTHWGGAIVAQLCTPFSPGDPVEDFWPALVTWLRSQGMSA